MSRERRGRQLLTLILSLNTTLSLHAVKSASSAAASQNPVEFVAELERPGATDGNFFGGSVAVDGHWAAVGSQTPNYIFAPSNVYAYDFSDPQNITRRTFVNPAPGMGHANKFGQSVAIQGSLLFVGDPEPGSTQPGVVHVYDLNSSSATPFLTIHAFDEVPRLAFGASLAVDGTRLAVGATKLGTGTLPPAVYVLDISDLNNIQQFKIAGRSNRFAEDIDLDGNFLIAGAYDERPQAAVYLYDLTNAQQILSERLTHSSDYFGNTVAISGRKAIVSDQADLHGPYRASGVVYLYDFSNWNSIERTIFAADDGDTFDRFGYSSGMDLTGNLAIVGARSASDGLKRQHGAVYVFDVSDPQNINQLRKIVLPDAMAEDLFGIELATDGQSLVVASERGIFGPMPGRAYLFAVPEPSVAALSVAALGMLCVARGRRRRTVD